MTCPRFSLRGLLILTALRAVFCYWHDRPRVWASWPASVLLGNILGGYCPAAVVPCDSRSIRSIVSIWAA